jgi:glutathione synthase/RimK-type ligase-like ATP-grasp enzyme
VILLWGLPDEEPMAIVRRELTEHRARVALLDQRRYAEVSGTVEVAADGVRGRLTLGDDEVDLDRLTGMYMRPYPLPAQQAGPVTPAHAAAVETLASTVFELAPPSMAVVNRPSAMASNDSKPRQLVPIEAAGFLVPDTIVTNDGEELAEFRRCHGTVVYKSTSGIRSIVNVIDAASELSDRAPRLATCPTQFQEWIPGDDYRVHVVGDQVFATRIVTDAIDYRYAGASGRARSMAAYNLPDDVSARALSLSRALGLLVSGVDLRCTPEGRWYCFEVNTSPAFSWFEHFTGQPIGAAIARLLIDGGCDRADPTQVSNDAPPSRRR